MKKIDKLIIFILLKICSILTNYSYKISSTDIFTINQKIEEIEEWFKRNYIKIYRISWAKKELI